MAFGVLSRLSSRQLRDLEEAVEATLRDLVTPPLGTEHMRLAALEVRDLVRLGLEVPCTLRTLSDSTCEQFREGLIEDYAETGAQLRVTFDLGRRILERVGEAVKILERGGGAVPGKAGLDAARAEIERLRTNLLEHWSDFSEEDAAAGLAEIEGGGGLDLDDAFAHLAGVDREAWMRRVEERKQTWRPS